MSRLAVTALFTALSIAACSKPTELASNANGKGRESVPAAGVAPGSRVRSVAGTS